MKRRVSLLFFFGIFAAGSTALSYYYYFVYSPPLEAAEQFMNAMELADPELLRQQIVVSAGTGELELRQPTDSEIRQLLSESFQRGRILDQRKREGSTRDYYYLVYRQPDARVYALVLTEFDGRFQVVVPEVPMGDGQRYLWDYVWTN